MKKLFLILALVLMFSATISAQTYHEYRLGNSDRFRIVAMPQLNGYTLIHMAEGGLFYALCRYKSISPENSFWIATAAKIAIEVIYDGFGNDYPFGLTFDPDGMDIADIAAGAFGAGLAYLCERQYLICKRLHIAAAGKMIQLAINF